MCKLDISHDIYRSCDISKCSVLRGSVQNGLKRVVRLQKNCKKCLKKCVLEPVIYTYLQQFKDFEFL